VYKLLVDLFAVQGMKDPITDSKSKVAMLKEHCPGVVIRELDAGNFITLSSS
jgi:hypothetical protein